MVMNNMTNVDHAVAVTNFNHTVSNIKKPPYLIVMANTDSKGKATTEQFIALDKPELLNGFIQVKGFYTKTSEKELSKSFMEEVNDINTNRKEEIVDVFIPIHRIHIIKNLVFNAVKTLNQTK